MDTRLSLEKMATTLTETLKPWPVPDRVYRVEDFGAIGDGVAMNTGALQHAIDACSTAGGGVVLVDRGSFVTGTIELKSGVMLEVGKGARILGSLRLSDYPNRTPAHSNSSVRVTLSLIYAENCERIGIRGEGVIDGRGLRKTFPPVASSGRGESLVGRPFLMRILECRNVVIDGIHLRDSASWLEDYVDCDGLLIQGINVENPVNLNNDGLDIDGCRNVIVRNCFINSWDDAICFKNSTPRTMENVLVENCTAYSGCNPLKFGTSSEGGFRNVLIRNIKLGGVPKDLPALRHRLAISGISWESVDGSTIENVLVTNAQIDQADSPIFLRLGNRGRIRPDRPNPQPGKMRHLIFDHISGNDNGTLGSIIAGIPGSKIQDVVIRNMKLTVAGGKTERTRLKIPEDVADYPCPFRKPQPRYRTAAFTVSPLRPI
jgi:Glycosyl hydrolases family 28